MNYMGPSFANLSNADEMPFTHLVPERQLTDLWIVMFEIQNG